MKNQLIFIVLLLCSCSSNIELDGYVYDYDSERPLKNVSIVINDNTIQTNSVGFFRIDINSHAPFKLLFTKEGYAAKEINRKPDSLGRFSKKSLKCNKFYMYKKASDFSR